MCAPLPVHIVAAQEVAEARPDPVIYEDDSTSSRAALRLHAACEERVAAEGVLDGLLDSFAVRIRVGRSPPELGEVGG